MKQRTGKSAEDIFGKRPASKTKVAPEKKAVPKAKVDSKRRPGRPPIHEDAWTKVTAVLFNRQIAHLDRLSADIRVHTGAAMSRSDIIRALIDALEASGLDVTQTATQDELRELLTAKLK